MKLFLATAVALGAIALVACTSSRAPERHPPVASAPPATEPSSPRIPDFSLAGYRMGMRPIPTVNVVTHAQAFGAKGDGVTDDTQALRAAIEATRGGALLLESGRFVLRDALSITRPGVVLRGRGPEKTVLVIPRSLTELHPSGDPLHKRFFGFVVARGKIEGAELAAIREPAQRGDRQLVVDRTFDLAAGELVRIRTKRSDALLRKLLGGKLEPGPQTPKDYEHYVDWVTPTAAIAGADLTLARDLRVDVRPEWDARVVAFHPTVEEVGIEDLSFEFPGSARPRMEDEGFNAIHFVNVAHSWVRNVAIVDAYNGINVEGSRFCQVERVTFSARGRVSPSGHHGLWAKESQDLLFSDFRFDTQIDDDLTVEAFANGNVFMRGVGQAMNFDHHRNAPYENLFTEIDVGSPARLWKSGGDENRGPHAGVRTTLWNIAHRGHPPPLPFALHFDKPGTGSWPELNIVGVAGYPPSGEREDVWIVPGTNVPNLYLAQRAARYGSPSSKSRR